MVIDTTGTVKDKYYTSSFGAPTGQTVSLNQRYRYTGKPFDEDGGIDLYYYGARYYDPMLGRFLAVDPLASKYPGWSPYLYTLDNPLRFIDPDGKDIALHVWESERTGTKMHSDLYFQDGTGEWFRLDAGDYGIGISEVDGPPEGSLLIPTTVEQDKLITKSALEYYENSDDVEWKFDPCFFNCKDIVSEVVNNSGAKVTIRNDWNTVYPSTWFNDMKMMTIDLGLQYKDADATRVSIPYRRYEIVVTEER